MRLVLGVLLVVVLLALSGYVLLFGGLGANVPAGCTPTWLGSMPPNGSVSVIDGVSYYCPEL